MGHGVASDASPGRSSPRPRVHLFIVVLLRSATGRCGLNRPPGCKLRPLSYPPSPKILSKIPFKTRRRHAIPPPFQPPPSRALVDCCVLEVGDWVVRSNSPARSQIATSIQPPLAKNIIKNPLRKTKAPRHPPAVSARANAVAG